MAQTWRKDYPTELALGELPGIQYVHKFGKNPNIGIASGFEAIWENGGDYTGHNATVAEPLEAFSDSILDTGTLLSGGTATNGSATTLIDTSAAFIADGVAIGDVVINDSRVSHGIITSVSTTQLTILRMEGDAINRAGDTYRVATAASTGATVLLLSHLLDGTFTQVPDEYVILSGTTPVPSASSYLRCSRLRCFGGAVNAGNIFVRQQTTIINIMAGVLAGLGTSLLGAYTIPKGKEGLIDYYFVSHDSGNTKVANARLMIRHVNDTYQVREENSISGTSGLMREFFIPKGSIPQMSDIKIMVESTVNNLQVIGGFGLRLIDIL